MDENAQGRASTKGRREWREERRERVKEERKEGGGKKKTTTMVVVVSKGERKGKEEKGRGGRLYISLHEREREWTEAGGWMCLLCMFV